MSDAAIIEMAQANTLAHDLRSRGVDVAESHICHHWRIRWIESGIDADQELVFESTAAVDRWARTLGCVVAWHYYETGL